MTGEWKHDDSRSKQPHGTLHLLGRSLAAPCGVGETAGTGWGLVPRGPQTQPGALTGPLQQGSGSRCLERGHLQAQEQRAPGPSQAKLVPRPPAPPLEHFLKPDANLTLTHSSAPAAEAQKRTEGICTCWRMAADRLSVAEKVSTWCMKE